MRRAVLARWEYGRVVRAPAEDAAPWGLKDWW